MFSKHVFSKHDLDVGLTSLVKHRINLMDETLFKQRHRKIPPAMFSEVQSHLRELSDAGIIRKSQSPWASNVGFLVITFDIIIIIIST